LGVGFSGILGLINLVTPVTPSKPIIGDGGVLCPLKDGRFW